MKDLYKKYFKTMKKNEIEENTGRLEDHPNSWRFRTNIVKITIMQNAMYRFNIIIIKHTIVIHKNMCKTISNFTKKDI